MTNVEADVKTDAIDYLLSVLFAFVFFHTKIRFSYEIEGSSEIALLNVWLAWKGTDIETASTVKSTGVTLSANVPGGIKIPYFDHVIISPIWKNYSERYVPTLPAIMSFNISRYISCSKISFFTSLW